MSKDPFEELFGPSESEPEASQPVPARERLAFEQAERVKTSPLPTTGSKAERRSAAKAEARAEQARQDAMTPAQSAKPSGTADGDRLAGAKPWIIVGLVTVVALIASIVVLNLVRAGEPAETASSETAITTDTSSSQSASKSPTTERDSEKTKTTEKESNKPPAVEVGTTGEMNVPLWGITAQISGKFGWPRYEIRGEQLVLLDSPLIQQLPDSCAAMREQWGVERTAQGGYEVLKPAQSCAAAPELFDEIWGLTAAMVETIQPG